MAKPLTMNARVGQFLAAYKSNGARALEMLALTLEHGIQHSNDFQPLTRLVYGMDPAHSATARAILTKVSRKTLVKGKTSDDKPMIKCVKGGIVMDNESMDALKAFVDSKTSIGAKGVKDYFKPAKKEESAFDSKAFVKRTLKALEDKGLDAATMLKVLREAETSVQEMLAAERAVEAPARAA